MLHVRRMKVGIHMLCAIFAKPVFAMSLLLWLGFLWDFSFQLIRGRQIGEEIGEGIERNPTEIGVLVLFIILSLAFIRMSWEGLLYWPKRKPSFRFEMKGQNRSK